MANRASFAPVATLTKTKLGIQQTVLFGITAVCTAVLLGAFTASFAIVASGGIRIAAISSNSGYQFPGPIKIFGQRDITQTAQGDIVPNRVFHPAGLAVQTYGTGAAPYALYVADGVNNRILAFKSLGSCSNDSARLCSTDADCTAEAPAGSCVVDRNRLPDKIFGQPNGTSGACNGNNLLGVYGQTNAEQLCFANFPAITNIGEYGFRIRMALDADGNLYVADAQNNRILRYNDPFSASRSGGKGDTVADYVWGQANFTDRLANRGQSSMSAQSLSLENLYNSYGPGLTVDEQGNLWVADVNNARVLRFPNQENGVPSPVADLSLGRPLSATATGRVCDGLDPYNKNPVPAINTPLNTFCFPTAIIYDPDSRTLYIADQHASRFRSRLLAYAPPYDAASVSEISIKNPNLIPFEVGGLFYYYPQIWDMTLNTHRAGALEGGIIWIVESILQRAALIDVQGNILKVINTTDVNTRGGWYPDACGQNNYDNGHQAGPGAVAMDQRGNLYLADNVLHKVSFFHAPTYEQMTIKGARCLPDKGIESLFGRPDGWMNSVSNYVYDGAVGVVAFGGQLIGKGNERFMVWNNYATKNSGNPADFVLGKSAESPEWTPPENKYLEGWSYHTIDKYNRLWTRGGWGELIVYQLPLTASSIPLKRFSMNDFVWQDSGDRVNTASHAINTLSLAYDSTNDRFWLADNANHRLLGFRVPQQDLHAAKEIRVDKVIGQPDKTTLGCNGSSDTAWSWRNNYPAKAWSLCQPTIVKFDRLGNLYAVEGTFECHGNNRIVMHAAEDLRKIETDENIFPLLSARKSFINKLLFSGESYCSTVDNSPGSPTGIAFTSLNQMIVGTDGYYRYGALESGRYDPAKDRATHQLYFYNNPLKKNPDGSYVSGQLADAVITVPLGASGELTTDEDDTLIIQDHTWPRILLVNFIEMPQWLTPVHEGAARGSISLSWLGDGETIAAGSTRQVRVTPFNIEGKLTYDLSLEAGAETPVPLVSGSSKQTIDLLFSEDLSAGNYLLTVRAHDASGNLRGEDARRVTILAAVKRRCVTSWSCEDWSACDDTGSQSRTCTDLNSCDEESPRVESRDCSRLPLDLSPLCVSRWSCSDWGDCNAATGLRRRVCTDISLCGNPQSNWRICSVTVPPIQPNDQAAADEFSAGCVADWSCEDWSACDETNHQYRSCTDQNQCGSEQQRTESQACSGIPATSWAEQERALVTATDQNLVDHLQGYIVLQVEAHGEAWYVDGSSGQKFYLKDGAAAYQALRTFGLGITNANLEKIPVGVEPHFNGGDADGDGLADKLEEGLGTDSHNADSDGDGYADGVEVSYGYNPTGAGLAGIDSDVADRLKGKILLQVQSRGQAWYVNPTDGKRYYLKDGDAAYQIMRFLSLGITNNDLRKIEVGSFE
ncbi:MAG: hypothetical protein A2951_03150 [Candidatus Buchananbacteria bacterium RIFCSPLOWO2_01_FULL_56_15]|uniref:SMP-30/Gluconolactonase/LRE-like region domain-containing protein n=1 Tax=Candidatus Buchananbacteria bacterium RIFCSPLOWO2_01_FULL_56_15 TaxID=1797547 RepID=A0A1G1YV93_9BACT|nr:MAG: hypothetical protein A2951_03150 [Candidatus Buchananbacteria bacterium RIFCSPLOWO2_01_FULL_56_15]